MDTNYDKVLVDAVALVGAALKEGQFDAVKLAVLKGGLKVEIAVGWSDDEDEDEEEDE